MFQGTGPATKKGPVLSTSESGSQNFEDLLEHEDEEDQTSVVEPVYLKL